MLVFVTTPKLVESKSGLDEFKKEHKIGFNAKVYTQDSLTVSYILVFDLSQKPRRFERRIMLKNTIVVMDSSEDELATLSNTGEVNIYTFNNNKLDLIKTWQIEDITTLNLNFPFIQFLYTKKGNQMLLKSYFINEYKYLYPKSDNLLKIVSLKNKKIESIIKINYSSYERLVIVKNDPDWKGDRSLYLFKLIQSRNVIDYF